MKYGIREICEVVLRAKGTQKVGTKTFYKDEPILYFDTLKTSSFEGSSTTVYAQGGRGNARLMSWDGDKSTTFTMEDALISPEGLMILAGAGLINPSQAPGASLKQHIAETVQKVADVGDGTSDTTRGAGLVSSVFTIYLPSKNIPYVTEDKSQDTVYVMLVKDGEIVSEPYIGTVTPITNSDEEVVDAKIEVKDITSTSARAAGKYQVYTAITANTDYDSVIVDYYVEKTSDKIMQIEITPDSFGGAFYLEASTLFRNEDGIDVPAEFIIPNCRVQSNFSFSMAATGDPSTFTFTLDCFPDYTRWDKTKKVLAAIMVIPESAESGEYRESTVHGHPLAAG